MLYEAELKIFQQFDFELNVPTAVDLLLELVYLEAGPYRRLPGRDLERLVQRAVEKVFQANFQIDVAHVCSQMAVAVGSLAFLIYFDRNLRERNAMDEMFQRLKQIYHANISCS